MPGMKQRVKDGLSLFLLRHSRFFDAFRYRELAGIPAGEDAAKHYYFGGWRTTDPSPRFSNEKYLEANEDVRRAGVCPLTHWLLYGKRQHYALYPGYVENHYHAYRVPRAVLRALGKAVCLPQRRRNRKIRLLVIAHVFYPEAADELLEYLKNLRGYRWDLAATIPEGAEAIREKIRQAKPNAAVTEVPNRGLDVLPFLQEISKRDLNQYDLIVKTHSKRCDPAAGRLADGMHFRKRDWFVGLHRAVLGSVRVHRNIDRLAQDGNTDLIAAKHLIIRDSPRRERLTRLFLAPLGLEPEAGCSFVAGGVWMMKAACARRLKEISVDENSFGVPKPGAFTLESALERYITGGIPATRMHGNTVCVFRQAINLIRFGRIKNDAGEPETGTDDGRRTAAFAVTETGEKAVAGDYFTAKELAEAMEKRGWHTKFLSRQEPGDRWYRVGKDTDVLISLLEDYDPQHITDDKATLVTIGWARNWFDKWIRSPGIGLYDLLLASSSTACREMEGQLGRRTELFPIATNAGRFGKEAPEEEIPEDYRCDVCFTGNRFGAREIETDLDPAALNCKVHIYGDGWEKVKVFAPYRKGHLPYEEIPKTYRGAKIVLDDATLSTQKTGSVNSRVFDALAAGCLVLTNNRKGAEETFEGKLPVFSSREELTALVKRYLEDGEARQAKVKELQAFVLERHTYEIRAAQLEQLLQHIPVEEAK